MVLMKLFIILTTVSSFESPLFFRFAPSNDLVLDSIFWYDNFGDPDFSRHAAIGKLWGLAAIRLADS
jgi:hypothetical protein